MNIAYLISVHIDATQLQRLIEALHPDAEFFIHIDKKTNSSPFAWHCRQKKNVHFIPNRVNVRWGTLVEVEYQMALLRAAVDYPRHFNRIFFLSGMDYPLWSNQHITQWLEEQDGKEILQGICMNTDSLTKQQHDLYTHRRPLFRMFSTRWNQRLSILCRKALAGLGFRKSLSFHVGYETWNLYKGSAWWCISEELARYVLNCWTEKREIRKYFRDSFGQAETVVQTIAFNSPVWSPRCMLYRGSYPGLYRLTPLHYIDYDPIVRVLTEEDLPAMMQSGKMFARKFRSGQSDAVISEIERLRK